MKITLKFVISFVLLIQMTLAKDSVPLGYKAIVENQLNKYHTANVELFHQELINHFQNSKQFEERVRKNPSLIKLSVFEGYFSDKTIPRDELKKIKVTRKGNTISLQIQTGERIDLDLSLLASGKLILDGMAIDINSFKTYDELKALIEKKYGINVTKFNLFNLFISKAHAVVPALLILVVVPTIMTYLILVGTIEYIESTAENERYMKYIKKNEMMIKKSIDICVSDLEILKNSKTTDDNNAKNDTIKLIDYMSTQKLSHEKKSIKEELLSCANIQKNIYKEKSVVHEENREPIYTKFKELCTLADILQRCLGDTEEMARGKGITINQGIQLKEIELGKYKDIIKLRPASHQ